MVNEARERISYLNQGPWIKKGAEAWEIIGRPPESANERAATSNTQQKLKRLLRPHWDDEIYYAEGVIRDSFDEALTLYQLYELAIENQYISINDIKEQVYKELTSLLWSDGARAYLQNYSYTSVIFLAQRVGLNLGFNQVGLPSIHDASEGLFASFLSQHALWYEDPLLDGWIGFLDDYQEYGDEQRTDKEVFRDFLESTQRKFDNEAALWAFVAGADRFVTRIADLAVLLSEDEKPSYGLFYAYWLAKFYGFDLTDSGYIRHDDQEDWGTAVSDSKRITNAGEGRTEEEIGTHKNALEAFKMRNAAVRKFWEDTIAHLNGSPTEEMLELAVEDEIDDLSRQMKDMQDRLAHTLKGPKREA
jgi:hypothetical protein